MQVETIETKGQQERLVGKGQILSMLFDESSRPSLRWLDYQIAARRIPFLKIGAKIFFDPPQVRAALAKKNTVAAK